MALNGTFDTGVSWPWTTSETFPANIQGQIENQAGKAM